MKKIFLLITLSFLLTSCFAKKDIDSTQTGVLDTPTTTETGMTEDANAKDPENLGTKIETSGTGTVKKDTTIEQPTRTDSASGKTEDQVVKDFESEIDGLLNTIDKDGGKK